MPGEPAQMSAVQPTCPCVQRESSSRLTFQMIWPVFASTMYTPAWTLDSTMKNTSRPGRWGRIVVDRDDVRVLAVDRPAHRAVGVQAGRAVEDLLAAVAVDVGDFDLVPAAAVGLGEAVEPPHFVQFAVISDEHLVLVETGLRDDGRVLAVQVGDGQMNPRRGLGEVGDHVRPFGLVQDRAGHAVEDGHEHVVARSEAG